MKCQRMPEDVRCIDMKDLSRGRPSDDQVWQMIIEMTDLTNSSAFQKLEAESLEGQGRIAQTA